MSSMPSIDQVFSGVSENGAADRVSAPFASFVSGREYSVPGKVFLLGEYAVLAGLPALIATVGPRFRLTAEPGRSRLPAEPTFHPQSPAGRLWSWAEQMGVLEKTLDSLSYEGSVAPGFGGSTAEFILLYRALADVEGWDQDWHKAWKLYRELSHSPGQVPPSGADLVAQWNGGIILFHPGSTSRFEPLRAGAASAGLLVFSAASQDGRKVATHAHLSESALLGSSEGLRRLGRSLEPSLQAGIQALQDGNPTAFGGAMGAYAEALCELGLECEATRRDREALSRLDAVAGCKGAGALQSDAIVVAIRQDRVSDRGARDEVIRLAESRGLELLADGISHVPGAAEIGAVGSHV